MSQKDVPSGGKPEFARLFLEALISQTAEDDEKNFDTTALKGLRVVEVGHGKVTCKFPVTQRVQNRYGTLHGGCIGNVGIDAPHMICCCCPCIV